MTQNPNTSAVADLPQRLVDAEAKLAAILEFVEQDAKRENAGHQQAPTMYAQGVRNQAAFTRGRVAGIVNNNDEEN